MVIFNYFKKILKLPKTPPEVKKAKREKVETLVQLYSNGWLIKELKEKLKELNIEIGRERKKGVADKEKLEELYKERYCATQELRKAAKETQKCLRKKRTLDKKLENS